MLTIVKSLAFPRSHPFIFDSFESPIGTRTLLHTLYPASPRMSIQYRSSRVELILPNASPLGPHLCTPSLC